MPREYLRPGEINTLTLFEEAGGDPSAVHFEKVVTETVCGSIFEQDTVELSCFGSKISKIDYASFGNPTGSCKAFTNGTCDIPQVQAKISQVNFSCLLLHILISAWCYCFLLKYLEIMSLLVVCSGLCWARSMLDYG